jgi:hypothetical protein
MKKEHDLSGAWRSNPYYEKLGEQGRKAILERYYASEGLIRLDADVAADFPDAESVNEALRLVVKLRKLKKPTSRRSRTKPAA